MPKWPIPRMPRPIRRLLLYAAILSAIFSALNILVWDILIPWPIIPHIGSTAPGIPSPTAETQKSYISYPSFPNDHGLQLNGAKIVSTWLELTPAQSGEAGAYYQNPIDISQSFETQFEFSLYAGTLPPADGFCFIFQSTNPSSTPLGNAGSGLGCEGIPSSLGIEFHIYESSGNPNRIAVTTNGTPMTNDTPTTLPYPPGGVSPPFNLYGNPHYAWINYNVASHTLKVYVAPIGNTRPANPSIAVYTAIQQPAYIGFTGATGAYAATQNILNWNFSYQ